MSELQRNITITVKDQTFKLTFPTVGDFIEIELMKQNLSGGNYQKLLIANLVTTTEALNRINMIAYFSVLLPDDFKKHLGVETFSDLDLIDSVELVNIWLSEVEPWVLSWVKVLKESRVVKDSTKTDGGK